MDGAAADAQAQGLIHLGSFYINCSSSSTNPMVHGADASDTLNGGSMHSSGAGGSFGSGGSGHSGSRKHGLLGSGSGSGGGGYSGYRPAPRTPYMASKLYTMTGSKVGTYLCLELSVGFGVDVVAGMGSVASDGSGLERAQVPRRRWPWTHLKA